MDNGYDINSNEMSKLISLLTSLWKESRPL